MDSKERLKKTPNYEKPDRVVVDPGSSLVGGISASPLSALRKSLI